MLPPARIFRVFVSSTFEDLRIERDALHRVFPLIRRFCEDRGARFDAVDLRWGISEEASHDQRTMHVCLEEVRRCQAATPRPNFLVLLGERYGWTPLPPEVPIEDFTRIQNVATRLQRSHILDGLYPEIDLNADPPVYCLRPRQDESDKDWRELEREGIALFRRAARELGFSAAQRAAYGGSATEQEIFHGLLRDEVLPDAREHVHAFLRETGVTFENPAARYLLDWMDDQPDEDAREAARSLKDQLRTHMPKTSVHAYTVTWTRSGLDNSYLGEVAQHARVVAAGSGAVTGTRPSVNLCQDVYDEITHVIEQELRDGQAAASIEAETSAHDSFANERGDERFFTGREEALSGIEAYLDGDAPRGLAVIGPSGSGKSALMARALLDRRKRGENAIVIARFIGVTPDSSDGRALLAGLSSEIAAKYGRSEPPTAADFTRLITIFHEHLRLATTDPQHRRLIIFLDALDQLSEVSREHELRWLPLDELPSQVRLVVSVASGRQQEDRVREKATDGVIYLSKMPSSEGETLLRRWLSQARRKLLPEQHSEIWRRFRESGLPLYLRFAFEEARLWRSFDGCPVLPPNIEGIINQTFSTLSDPANHGRPLVRASLAYLAASREGLTENELLGLLWKEKSIQDNFHQRFPKSPSTDTLPRVVWSLLYYDLKPYLTERNANGVPVLSFFHTQMRTAAVSAYLPEEERRNVHSRLAEWFTSGKDAQPGAGTARFDVRSVTELPYQQRSAGMWQELHATLCNLSFIEAKCGAGLLYDLLADYDAAMQSQSPELTSDQRGRIGGFARFVRAHAHILATHPGLTLQQAFNEPDLDLVYQAANEAAEAATHPFFRYINKPQVASPCVLTLFGHTGILSTCNFSQDGKQIVSGASDGEIRIWDAASGQLMVAFRNHPASVEFCSFSHDGSRVFSAMRDGLMQICDAESGRLLKSLRGHGAVTMCRLTKDNRRMISASWDGTVRLWDVATAKELRVFNHGAQVYCCEFSPDEKIFASGAADSVLRFWDVEKGTQLHALSGHEGPVMDCRFSDNGRYVFTASQDCTVKRWDFSTREAKQSYEGHDAPVRAVAVSKDAGRLVSASQDGSLIFWDTATGKALTRVKEHLDEIWGLALSPDGKQAVSASWDMTLKVWSMGAVEETARALHARSGDADEGSKGLWGYMIPCCCSQDGRYYAAGSTDASVRVWDAPSGRSLGIFRIHNDYVFCCAFSPDSRWVITGCWDGAVKLLEVGQWGSLDVPHHTDMVLAAGFTEQGTRIFSCSTDGVRICDFDGALAVERSFWRFEAKPSACVFRSDGTWFVTGLESGEIVIVEPNSGTYTTLSGRHEGLSCCALSPSGNILATGSEHGTIKFWDLVSRREMAEVRPHEVKVAACNFSPDGRRLVICSWDYVVKVLDVAAPAEPVLVLRGHTNQMQDSCFTPDGKRILSASLDGTLRLWDSATGAYLGSLLAPADSASICRFQTGGPFAVTASHRHSVRLWDSASGHLTKVLSGHTNAIHACDFSARGTFLTASADSTLRLWDAQSGNTLFVLTGHDGPARCCAFSPDGNFIVSGSWDKTVRVWDAATGLPMRVLSGHEGWVTSVFALPGSQHAASCSLDGTVRVWDIRTGLALRILGNGGIISAAAVSAAGSRIAAGYEDGTLRIWDLISGVLVATLEGHSGAVRQCAFSDRVLSASMDGTLRVWDPNGGSEPVVLQGHAAPVLTCAFADLGRSVVSGGEDDFVKVWDSATARQLAEYWAGAAVEAVSVQLGAGRIGVGDRTGKFHLIELLGPGALKDVSCAN
jgi:WD40 repeat protein